MWVNIVGPDPTRAAREDANGPTKAEAKRMAEFRLHLISRARTLETSDPDRALENDLRAFDLEVDLRRYGFENLI